MYINEDCKNWCSFLCLCACGRLDEWQKVFDKDEDACHNNQLKGRRFHVNVGIFIVVLGEIVPVTSLQQARKFHHISTSATEPKHSLTMKVKVLIQNQRGSVGNLATTSILILEYTYMAIMVV